MISNQTNSPPYFDKQFGI